MIRDLVLYFLRQGTYSGPGDIAVLCAYLGQLQKVRAALRDLKIAVAVDERDAEQLAQKGLEEGVEFEEVVVAKHVSASGNVGQLISCKRYILGFIGSSRNCRYIPRTGGKNCHCLPCSKLGPVRHWIGIHWFSEGQLLCTADVLALYILINLHFRVPTASTSLYPGQNMGCISWGMPQTCARTPHGQLSLTKWKVRTKLVLLFRLSVPAILIRLDSCQSPARFLCMHHLVVAFFRAMCGCHVAMAVLQRCVSMALVLGHISNIMGEIVPCGTRQSSEYKMHGGLQPYTMPSYAPLL